MKADNLKELRELRIQEKAIKARIDEISGKATDEAVAILEAQGEIKGEFEVEGVGKFQLQRTESFNFADYRRYPQEQAVKWRENAKEKTKEQNLVKARTAVIREVEGLCPLKLELTNAFHLKLTFLLPLFRKDGNGFVGRLGGNLVNTCFNSFFLIAQLAQLFQIIGIHD